MSHKTFQTSFNVAQNSQNFFHISQNTQNLIPCYTEHSKPPFILTELSKPHSMSHRTLKTSFHISQNSRNLIPCHTELSKPLLMLYTTLKTSPRITQNSQNLLSYSTYLSKPPSILHITLKPSFLNRTEFSTTPQNLPSYRTLTFKNAFHMYRNLKTSFRLAQISLNYFHIAEILQVFSCHTELSKSPLMSHRTLKTSLYIAQNSQYLLSY